jgi:hypothetical protein
VFAFPVSAASKSFDGTGGPEGSSSQGVLMRAFFEQWLKSVHSGIRIVLSVQLPV